MLIFISSTLLRQGVCVYHLNRCKTSLICRGHGSCFPSHANEAMGFSRKGTWTHAPVPAIYIYIYIVPPLGAYKSQLGGTYILSLLVYTFNVSCDPYIYIYIYCLILSCLLFWCHCHDWDIPHQNSGSCFSSSV